MIKDENFTFNDITSSNIAKISQKYSILAEQRICEISELAREAANIHFSMLEEGYDTYEVLSVISGAFSDYPSVIHDLSLRENMKRLYEYGRMADAADKVVFTELFIEYSRELGIIIHEGDFLYSYFGDETFTYVKNPLADEAYDVFSQKFDNPKVKYSTGLLKAARAVSSGEAEYCLLPLEERGGARLATVAQILFSEDLRICSVTPVFGFEGNSDMKYALVAKHFLIPEIGVDDDRYLEIRLRADSSMPLAELFFAADSLGASLYRVNTISFETEDGEVAHYSLVFKDEKKDFAYMLTFLTLFSDAYTPIGIYKNLE